jgi:hypothetical protein
MSILQTKEAMQEIENSIDQYIFFEMMKNYSDLIEQLKPIAQGSGSTPHSLLMDYMFSRYKKNEMKLTKTNWRFDMEEAVFLYDDNESYEANFSTWFR